MFKFFVYFSVFLNNYIYFLYFAAPPVNTRALASLAPVSGDALHRHLPKILPALISALAESQGKVSL